MNTRSLALPVLGSLLALSPAAQTASLIHRWAGEGNPNDSVGALHGTQAGAPGYGAGRIGQTFTFDSNDDRVTIPNDASLTPTSAGFTAEFWMKASSSQATSGLVTPVDKSHGFGSHSGWGFQMDSAGAIGVVWGEFPQGVNITTANLFDDTWHHLAFTYDGPTDTVRTYLDGAPQTSQSPTGELTISGTGPLNVGYVGGAGTPQRFFTGSVDELGIYDRALSDSEIHAIFVAGSSDLAVGAEPRDVVAFDLDGDGDLDLATANHADNTVSILPNNGDGTFAAATTITLTAADLGAIALGATVVGGQTILAVACNDSNTVCWITDPLGATPTKTSFTLGGLLRPVRVACRSGLANSSFDDVCAVACQGELLAGGGGLAVLQSTGLSQTFPLGPTVGVVVCDLDADDIPDIAALSTGGGSQVKLFRNDGLGGFTDPGGSLAAGNANVLARFHDHAEHFGDGSDLACASLDLIGNGDLIVFRNTGSGSLTTGRFTPVQLPAQNTYPLAMASGDFEDNTIAYTVSGAGSYPIVSRPDLVVVDAVHGVTSLHDFDGATFGSPQAEVAGTNPVASVVADLDGDGCDDLAVANQGSNDVTVTLTIPPALAESYGTGCAGTAGVPLLTAVGLPVSGSTSFAVTLSQARPFALAVLLFSGSAGQDPIGPCTFYLHDIAVSVLGFTDGSGSAALPISIPASVFLGADLYAQGVVFDPNGALNGQLALTAGLRIQVGQ
ncbi:MAG: LamG domain-containing protein [Planctomycetota bacterium]